METDSKCTLLPRIAAHVEGLVTPLSAIPSSHQDVGRQFAQWVSVRHRRGDVLPVVVVCTGNSRRSMFGAMMGNAAAGFIGLPEIRFWSAGTAPSAFNPRTIAALRAIGFEIEPTGDEAPRGSDGLPNPRYRVRWGSGEGQDLVEFSKALGDPALPDSGFAALMVCGEADAGCPVVPGAAIRISMPFPDPKTADDTPREGEQYAATRDALGRIMLATLSEASDRISVR